METGPPPRFHRRSKSVGGISESDERHSMIAIAVSLAIAFVALGPLASTGFEHYQTPGLAPVNSWWLDSSDGGVIVFDTLRTIADANVAIAKLRQRHRPVRGILITHPHPDHVTGLGTFKDAFPGAPIYSTREGDAWLKAHGRELLEMNVQ